METIFALSTALGKAGVAVVRLSGDLSWSVVERLAGSVPEPRELVLRRLNGLDGSFLDQAMVVVFEKGRSFTGERSAELHLHGSVAVVRAVLSNLAEIPGVRIAEPGAFTRRALENGKIDLTQVEALADLIDAETEVQRKHALDVLSGRLRDKVSDWRNDLVKAASLLEVTIDFADEDVPFDVSDEVGSLLSRTRDSIREELQGIAAAERIRAGFEVAIVGVPNTGKSTLLNYLAGREAAITSHIAGTTRDVIEVRMDVAGLPVTFLDTAGLRETRDPIEQEGVARTKARAGQADLRIHLLEPGSSVVLDLMDEDLLVFAKDDEGQHELGVSGRTGYGVPRLLEQIGSSLTDRASGAAAASRERHMYALKTGMAYLEAAGLQLLSGPETYELASEDVRAAVRALESVVGHVGVEALLDKIFSSFCLGK